MPKFELKDGDIVLYLALFERQAKRAQVDMKDWVSSLLTLLPAEIVQLIARESEEKFEDYEHIKDILLKRFKMNAEGFRKKFVQLQKHPEKSWRDFTFELTNYFQEWLDTLEINDFDMLKKLMITDQAKRRVPGEIREHFLDEWSKLVTPTELADKLDEYESVRASHKKSVGIIRKEKFEQKTEGTDKGRPYLAQNHKSYDKFSRNRNTSINDNQQQKKPPSGYNFKNDYNKSNYKPSCFTCGAEGHISKFCTSKTFQKKTTPKISQSNLLRTTEDKGEASPQVLTARVTIPVSSQSNPEKKIDELEIIDLRCGNTPVKGIIDSGAQISVLHANLVTDNCDEDEGRIKIVSAFGECETVPLKIIPLKIDDNLHGKVPIVCAISKKLTCDMLVCPTAYETLRNNVQLFGVESDLRKDRDIQPCGKTEDMQLNQEEFLVNNIQTEGEVDSDISVDKNGCKQVSGSDQCSESKSSFIRMQREDKSLDKAWDYAEKRKNNYEVSDGVLVHSEWMNGETIKQVVLPIDKRQDVLKMAHEIPLAGHLGELKTRQRIKYSFFWPTIKQDVRSFCESCKPCQLRRTATYRDRIPIQPIVRPEIPFEVWSLDCIGPLEPPSGRGHKYAICAIDLCTKWAEVIPVKEIGAKTTCNVLMKIFTQTGFPKMICTDQGSNFTANLTEAFLKILGISPRFSTPGHPESMGAVERWNRTLKNMMNKNIQEHGRNWDLHLPYLLFAYREVPHSTTGVSPFQLVYGRLPPGPLALLKDVWIGERTIPTQASRPVTEYLQDLIEKLRKAHEIAAENSEVAQENYTSRYNLRSREKSFKVGDKVLILMPSSTHKLLNTWIGPATVVELTRSHSAKVELEDGSVRELHFNKLRPYMARIQHIGLVFEQDEDFGSLHYAPTDVLRKTIDDIQEHLATMQGNLPSNRKYELFNILKRYPDVFSSKPGQAKVKGHTVNIDPGCSPRRLRPYRVPITLQEEVDRQIKELLELDLIEPSESDWAHPVVCVAKKDGSIRICIDFRYLNSYTVADAYPMKIAKDLLYQVGKAHFISVLDLTKGYWQIPMGEEAKRFTAFVTHSGHYQWKVMPFGMKNSGSTFQKSMDKVLEPHRKYCRSYIDDVAIFSESWNEHLYHVDQVFKTLRDVGLTVNLEKCDFGKDRVKFLGHIIGSGQHMPDPQKVEVLQNMNRPTTKRELRSLLGLASYYRDYIADFAVTVLPLTNLTRKNIPNQIPWDQNAEASFQKLKAELIKMPSLHTPDLDKPFQLYTDASATAIGACLAQNDNNGKEKPIAFFSKKLSPTQMKWSTIEREAYGVLEALKKFDTWIFGAKIQVISDHNPLTYLTQSVPHGAKLTRWALALQRYNLTVTYRKGNRHGNADSLSRLPL